MRGKENPSRAVARAARITPAHAGKSARSPLLPPRHRDHPRACREKLSDVAGADVARGSPPRMRGKAHSPERQQVGQRITPAHAGKRPTTSARAGRSRDHPRACGEKMPKLSKEMQALGSPPRMRGKAGQRHSRPAFCRITPAYAGKRQCTRLARRCSWDHPRVCGEKKPKIYQPGQPLGSPPRMRGKARGHAAAHNERRITPAYAGKRLLPKCFALPSEDHPRVCGEKQ